MLKTLWITSRWGIIPILLGFLIFDVLLPNFKWNYELFHALIEGGGAIVAFILATIIYNLVYTKRLASNYYWLVLSFVSMGTLDLFHSQIPPGQAFVWLHSCATFIGGIFASLIWFSNFDFKRIQNLFFVSAIFFISLIFSLTSIAFPDSTIVMLDANKNFTFSAKALNLIGGLGFIIAWCFFVKEYYYQHSLSSSYFSNNYILFGLAGLLFELSVLWDGNWWLWHVLRALAYFLLMGFFGLKYVQKLR